MSSPWITGEKLMAQYDIPAILLGSACFGGALTAFRSDSLEEVKEILLVERIYATQKALKTVKYSAQKPQPPPTAP